MKRILSLLILCYAYPSALEAQLFTTKGSGLTIKEGATVVINSLQFHPTQDFKIEKNKIELSTTAAPGKPQSSIKKVYQFEEPIQFQGLLGIHVNPLMELNGNDLSRLELAYSPTGDPKDYIVSKQSVTDLSKNFVFETLGPTTMKLLTAVQRGSALPLHLLYFKIEKTANNNALISWAVADELDIHDYSIERSKDGKSFNAIGAVAATCNGCGLNTPYQFKDTQPYSGINYYRLAVQTKEGEKEYSNLLHIEIKSSSVPIYISPNPATTTAVINGLNLDDSYQVHIYNAAGKKTYYSQIKNQPQLTIHVSQWANGIYYIQLTNAQGNSWHLQLLIKK